MTFKARVSIWSLVGVFCGMASNAQADEGMWLLNKLPEKQLKEKHNFQADPAWVEHIQKSCIRISDGGSASFVSPEGLLMTNHHVGSEAIQQVSNDEHNYLRDGFYAKTRDEEIKCPGMELSVLMKIEEITDKVNAGVTASMNPSDAAASRKEAMARIEKEAAEKTKLSPEIVTLYKGARYDLYLYKRYTDVRIVFAPEQGIAAFGGDLDNFEYPRFCLDVCFMRAYEDGKPAKTPDYLKWSASGPKEGELIFCAGHPGRTQRLFTVDHLKFMRDIEFPLILQCYNEREVELLQFCAQDDTHKRVGMEDLLYIQNGRKAYGGMVAGLQDATLMGQKQAKEMELKHFLLKDDVDKKDESNPWFQLSQALEKERYSYKAFFLLENRRAKLSRLFDIAKKLVRGAEERAKPDGERLEEFRESNLPSLKIDLFSAAPIDKDLEQLRLSDGLLRMGRILGGDDPIVVTALGGKDCETRAAELLAGTKLADVALRKKLFDSSVEELKKSQDTMIKFAFLMEKHARELVKRREEQYLGIEAAAYAKIAAAKFESEGDSVYPDATFTLRLAIGTVQGYEVAGNKIPAMTTFKGLYERGEKHHQQEPFTVPKRWMDAKSKLNLDTPFDFVSTNDIIGGNSGSPMFNSKGEVTGLIFDGNIQSLVWDFQFDQVRARAVSVHSQALIEALEKVYEAKDLVKEILGK